MSPPVFETLFAQAFAVILKTGLRVIDVRVFAAPSLSGRLKIGHFTFSDPAKAVKQPRFTPIVIIGPTRRLAPPSTYLFDSPVMGLGDFRITIARLLAGISINATRLSPISAAQASMVSISLYPIWGS